MVEHARGVGVVASMGEEPVERLLIAPPERTPIRTPLVFDRPESIAVGRVRPAQY